MLHSDRVGPICGRSWWDMVLAQGAHIPRDEWEGSMTPHCGRFADTHQLLAVTLASSFKPEPPQAAALPQEV